MIHSGPLDPLAPIHHREYTSILRGFTNTKDGNEKIALSGHSLPSLSSRTDIVGSSGDIAATLARRPGEALEYSRPAADKPRSLPSILSPYEEVVKAAVSPSPPSASVESETAKATSTMAATTMPIAGSAGATEAVSPLARPAKLLEKTPQAESPSYRASPRTVKDIESYRRQQQDDDEMSPADEDGKQLQDVSRRLPGIAHLDRQMHSPWNAPPPPRLYKLSNGGEEREMAGDRMRFERTEPSRWTAIENKRSAVDDDEYAAARRHQAGGDSYSDGPSPHLPSPSSFLQKQSRAAPAMHSGSAREGTAAFGKRSGSPLNREHDYEMSTPRMTSSSSSYPSAHHTRFASGGVAHHDGIAKTDRLDTETATWPNSPTMRHGSPRMDGAEGEYRRRRFFSSASEMHSSYTPHRLSTSSQQSGGGNGDAAGLPSHSSNGYDYMSTGERASLPPLFARGGNGGRLDTFSGAPHHSPSLRSSYDGLHRVHGGSGSSASSVGEQHYSYGGYRGGLATSKPRSLSTSLRSMPSSHPYESAHGGGGAEAVYYDDERINDRGVVHSGAGTAPYSRHEGSNAASPRHHPYAMPSQHHPHHRGASTTAHGHSPYLDAMSIAGNGADPASSGNGNGGGGSPSSMPRRRGKLPKPVTDLLKTWLLDHAAHPYPTEDEKRRLCAATGLSISQVSNWFINARRRILVPQGSGHFGVAPSSVGAGPTAAAAAAAAAAASGLASDPNSAGKRHSPSGSMLASHHLGHASVPPPAQHHQSYLHRHSHPSSAYAGSSMSHYPPQYSQHHHQQQHHGYPSPPSTRPSSGLPLGPPPLPSSHHYTASGAGHAQPSHHRLSEPYPRSADQSPILTRRMDSPP